MGTVSTSIICVNLNFEKPCVVIVGKDGHRKIPTIRRTISCKSRIWDQYLSKSMNWFFGKHLKPRNQETIKPENYKTI